MKAMLLVLLAAAGWAQAGEGEHRRGDFVFSVGPVPSYVVDREVPGAWDPKAPGTSDTRWRYWLFDEQIDRRGGRLQDYLDHVFEPKSQASLGDAGRFQVNFNPAYQTLTIHRVELRRNGKWESRLSPDRVTLARRESRFERDMADGVVTALILLDDVRVDDVVRVSYTVYGSNPILAGQSSDWIRLGWRNPMLDVHLRVLEDPGTALQFHLENTDIDPVVRHDRDAVEVTLHAHGAESVTDEETYPVWFQPFPMIQVSRVRSWDEVVKWAIPLYPKVGALPADLEAKLVLWNKVRDPYERLNAALRTVQEDVRYFGVEMGENTHRPTSPDETWRRRYGDCKDKAYLLVTLLGRLGIEAVPALVSTERGRAIADFVPGASLFDHVVVRARVGSDVIWVDPTMSHQGGDARDSDLSLYGMALPVVAGGDRLQAVEPTRPVDAGIRAVERYVPDSGGHSVGLTIETTYRGRSADFARRSIAGQRPEEWSRQYADYYRKRFGEVDVVAVPLRHDDLTANTLKITESYLLKAPFESDGSNVRALDVYGETLSGASALPPTIARSGPLDFAAKGKYRHEIEIDVPDKWKAAFGRERVTYQSPAFAYERDVEVKDRMVKVIYQMDIGQSEVASDKVAAHLGELRKLRDSLSARLRFSMPAVTNATDREQRLRNLLRDVSVDGASN